MAIQDKTAIKLIISVHTKPPKPRASRISKSYKIRMAVQAKTGFKTNTSDANQSIQATSPQNQQIL